MRSDLIGSTRPPGNTRRPDSSTSTIGQVLAAIALLVQIALPGLHTPVASGFKTALGELSVGLDEHSLCLAPRRGDIERPSDQAPRRTHHELAICCFWHSNTALALAPSANLEPVAFARPAVKFAAFAQVPWRRVSGAIGARAPPIQA